MNASLPDLQTAVDSSVMKVASSPNLASGQQHSAFPQGFGPVLEQAALEVSEASSLVDATAAEVRNLYRELQNLPEGGKWLPLLQQVLDDAAAAGTEPRQLLQQIAGSVRELQSQQSLPVAESVQAVLAQYLNEPSALARSKGPAAVNNSRAGMQATVPALPVQQGVRLDAATQALPGTTVRADNRPAETALPALDRTAGLLPPTVVDRVQPEQTALAAALRQLTGNRQSTVADTTARTELPAPALVNQPAASNAAAATGVAALPSVSVNHSLHQPGWDQAFGEKIQWMVSQQVQGAQIRLNPAQLGPMEVNIQLRNDQATIQFNSAHVVVRDALEAAIPRLREMMESSGVELVDVDVSGQSFAERQDGSGQQPVVANALTANESGEAETIVETSVAAAVAAGRLDLFV